MKYIAIQDPYGIPLNHKGLRRAARPGVTSRIQVQRLKIKCVYSWLVAVGVGMVWSYLDYGTWFTEEVLHGRSMPEAGGQTPRLSLRGVPGVWAFPDRGICLTEVTRACGAMWGGRPRPAPGRPASRRTRRRPQRGPKGQGDRPTKPMPERLPE